MTDTHSNDITVTPTECAAVLRAYARRGWNLMIDGQPGIGKSDLFAQVTDALIDAGELDHAITLHPAVADPTRYDGHAVYDRDDKQARHVPYAELAWLVGLPESARVAVLVDDLGQATPAVQNALMHLLLSQEINGQRIRCRVAWVACTNRKGDRANVRGISEPVKGRFHSLLHLTPDLGSWLEWAARSGVPWEMIAFVKFRPEVLSAWEPTSDIRNTPTPRTIARAADILRCEDLPPECLLPALAGAIGERFASELVAYLKVVDDMPSIDGILLRPDTAPVPAEPGVTWATCAALAARTTRQTAPAVMQYVARMPAEFAVFAIKSAVLTTPGITNTREFTAWAAAHPELLGYSDAE